MTGRLIVTTEQRFSSTPDGRVFTPGPFGNSFWRRYGAVFRVVTVVARAKATKLAPIGWERVDGGGVEVHQVPDYRGPVQFMFKSPVVLAALKTAVQVGDVVLARALGALGSSLVRLLPLRSYPFGIEVGGDPEEVFAPGANAHPLRPLLRPLMAKELLWMCRRAVAVSYVTRTVLQAKYPASGLSVAISDVELDSAEDAASGRFVTHYSSVSLTDDAFAARAYPRSDDSRPPVAITVGSLDQPYKGIDVLLRALAICHQSGRDLALVVVGDGLYRDRYCRLAERLGVMSKVRFVGALPGPAAVRRYLDRADLFVLASRTEGLPRALIEAMARGLPCIATAVGGVPELLEPSELVTPGEPKALAQALLSLVDDPGRLRRLSSQNLHRSAEYKEDILCKRRNEFYESLRAITSQWLANSCAA